MKRFLKKLFSKTGREGRSLQEQYPQYEIGKWSYGHLRVRSRDQSTKLRIGAFCSFAGGVQIFLGGEHATDVVSTFPFPAFWPNVAQYPKAWLRTRGDVIIGNDVWIGTEAMIMSGVRVGNGAVIGARAVVTKDVPPYAIVGGVPARIIRMRFDDETIDRLEALAWWNWDDCNIARFVPKLLSGEVESFLGLAESEQFGINALAQP